MRKIKFITGTVLMGIILFTTNLKAQTSDTSYLSTTHVLTAQGMILSNITTNRISYTEGEDRIIEETVMGNSSYPEPNGGTHVSKMIENYTSINGQVVFYKGKFIEGDSTMIIQAEKDGDDFIVQGKNEGEMDFYEWDRQKMKDIDFFVFAIDYEKQKFTKRSKIRKIYDMYSLTLRDNKLSHLGNETLDLAGETFECSIIKFNYKVVKGKMWWVKLDDGNYLLVKEEAESAHDGPFNMDLTDFSTEKPSKSKIIEGEFGF